MIIAYGQCTSKAAQLLDVTTKHNVLLLQGLLVVRV